jgi:Protein of unknown function (DUF3011)
MQRSGWALGIIALAGCATAQAAIDVTCSSERGGRQYCQADTGGGVNLLHQISTAICRKGYSWGSDGSGVWVDHGCKAVFAIGNLGLLGALLDNGKEYAQTHTFQCEADSSKKRRFCQADTRGGLRMLQPVNSCIYGKTWGYDAGGVWVESNCKAEFETGGGEAYAPREVPGTGHIWGAVNGLKAFTCASEGEAKHYCEADTSEGAVLTKNLGTPACVRGETWGFDRRGVWVDHGCRAEFDTVFKETILK